MNGRMFASDNASGVHPSVLAAIARANEGHCLAYGDDRWTREACSAIENAFDTEAETLFCFGGTGANVIALGSVMRPYDSVFCADSAHIWNDECAAPQRFCGGKFIPLEQRFGKIDCATIAAQLKPTRGVHHARPRVVSLTQPTEWGAVYSCEELRELTDFAHAHDLIVHVDGARFANAVAALGVSLADAGPRCGIDVLSFGGTKNGLLGAEAIIYFNPELAAEAARTRKQATQLASKMRFIAAQFLAYLEDELWRDLAGHANAMAKRLAAHCDDCAELEFASPVDCNMLFPCLPATALSALQESFIFHTWDERASIARWITSFDTCAEDVDVFGRAVRAALTHAPG